MSQLRDGSLILLRPRALNAGLVICLPVELPLLLTVFLVGVGSVDMVFLFSFSLFDRCEVAYP